METTVNPGQVVAAGQRLGSIDVDDASVEPVVVAYFPVGDGKKIGPGMRIQLTPDSISRERFGGMLGTVSATSSFPATKESAANVIGNSELAEALLQQGPQIEVLAGLLRDPSTFSGYRWSSSKGPELRISPGTTLAARVTVEGRAPITYVLPFLRSVSGIY
jgi:HlyD family secretion protein